jgi:eukaryotic-like serine/threonine-protein kinase
MQLWAEYEGKTIDGAFPLTRLLRPEGSSAFFSTSNGDGLHRVIRLIESRADDDDILSRWRGVAALDHPNILKLEDFGQVVVDQTSLVYAVMEPVDANLGEVVSVGCLTIPETRQIAISLLSVLEALHSHGFIHGHVQPAQVVAVNEVVKLQCDCIRDSPEGQYGQELKKRDVHDLAALLLQALTHERTLDAAAVRLPLPAPFDQIVLKGMSGEWGLAEIAAALEMVPTPLDDSHTVIASAAPIAAPPESSPALAETVVANAFDGNADAGRSLVQEKDEADELDRRVRVVAVAEGVALLLVLAISWYLHSGAPAKSSIAPQQASASGGNQNAPPHPITGNAVEPAPPPVQEGQTATVHDQWRVIAYTYRHEKQAKNKAAKVTQKHPELLVEVFRPNGAGPYLVTVGGTMDRNEALSLAKKIRREGFPRDTYIQNYRGKER